MNSSFMAGSLPAAHNLPPHHQAPYFPTPINSMSTPYQPLPPVPHSHLAAKDLQVLVQPGQFKLDEVISILTVCTPLTPEEYSEHLFKISSLLHEDKVSASQAQVLEAKFFELMDLLPKFVDSEDPLHSKLYLLIEKNFDVFIRISTNHKNLQLASRTIRFLTNVLMNLSYWELYNLLAWKPSIYHFLTIIHFDFNECYTRFIKDYANFNYKKSLIPEEVIAKVTRAQSRIRAKRPREELYEESESDDDKTASPSPGVTAGAPLDEHDSYITELGLELTPKEKKKIRVDAKLAAHRIIKKTQAVKPSNKLSNYDPDVVHECQLPSADEPDKLCLRRFSRKYELIRHQETVHSKKKKLFKCYVCVKQNPKVGPRIFTRHDTLAKHIRVNHKISGKEAKAEVAYSKKHAEVVEEGDITVHVGRRKTKVDFELRAHMERRRSDKGDDFSDLELDSNEETLDEQ